MENIEFSKPDRALRWLSSFDAAGDDLKGLNTLQEQMKFYYSNFVQYYEEIEFGQDCWRNGHILYQDILNNTISKNKILEVGCGQAGILTTNKINPHFYYGLDFSESLIKSNKHLFPDATFIQSQNPVSLPFNDNFFDFVFSLFVIEHSVFPHKLLLEQIRVLKSGGTFCLICPDFLGVGRMTSQRNGFSSGTGTQKLKKGKFFDAIISSFDAKIRIPFFCRFYRKRALAHPKFYINTRPVCFCDPFLPDVDAVYITFKPEIEEFLENHIEWLTLDSEMSAFCKANRLIYLKGVKK